MSAITYFNLELVDLPGLTDDVFAIISDGSISWFRLYSGNKPEPMDDGDALEQAGSAILELLEERKEQKNG